MLLLTCRAGVILTGECSVIMAATFNLNGSGTLGRKRNLYQGGGRRSKKRRGVGMGEWRLPSRPSPYPTVHSNSKSIMAGRINDHELKTLARSIKDACSAGYVAMRLFSNWSKKTSHQPLFFYLTAFWRLLLSITEQTLSNLESVCRLEDTYNLHEKRLVADSKR